VAACEKVTIEILLKYPVAAAARPHPNRAIHTYNRLADAVTRRS
jgi:hypothetical protein